MKKLISVLCSAALVAMFTVSVSAAGYGYQPIYPENPPLTPADDGGSTAVIDDSAITDAISNGTAVSIADDATLTKNALAEIAKAGAPVTFEADDFKIVIDPADIGDDAQAIDLSMEIGIGDTAVTLVPSNVELPVNSIVIAPSASGAFGFALSVVLPASAMEEAGIDPANAHVFYIDDDGNVEDLGLVTVNEDGSVSFKIDHASSYLIAEDAPQAIEVEDDDEMEEEIDEGEFEDDFTDEDGNEDASNDPADTDASANGDSNPATGVTLAIGAALASGIVAIVSRKTRKTK